jgi:hypothetical protein
MIKEILKHHFYYMFMIGTMVGSVIVTGIPPLLIILGVFISWYLNDSGYLLQELGE